MRFASKLDLQPRQRLTEARTQRGWSQQDLAERIGTTAINVSRWERGLTRAGPYFRSKLCALFGKSEQDLDLAPTPASHAAPLADTSSSGRLYDPSIPLPSVLPLVGRDNELEHLKNRLLTTGNVALTAINGMPGVGKTALAIALAHDPEIQEHFRDGILWAALGPHPNLPGLFSRWGVVLGISSAEMTSLKDGEARAMALHRTIGQRHILLIIDDAWKLEDALALKVGGLNCAHLVTTRYPTIAIAVAAEGATVLHELGEVEGITLLRMLAPGVVDREEQRMSDLVRAVGGLPLALTLLGNYLRMQAYGGQARRIDGVLKRLSTAEERLRISEPRALVERHSSLRGETPLSLQSVFAVTDQKLDVQTRAAFYALSVLPPKPNSFSEKAALAVAACSEVTLDILFDAGLLESAVSGRYSLHQTIADYARLYLQDVAAYERLIAYFTRLAETHQKDYELLEQESGIILVALETAYELEKWAELVRCACAFAPFLLSRGIYTVAEQHIQRAHDAAIVIGDSHGITTSLLYLGQIAQKQGKYSQAETSFQEGLVLARKTRDRERISALLANLGWVTWKQGDYSLADTYSQEGLILARQLGNSERISGLLETLGSVAAGRGDYALSETCLLEGLQLARETGDRERICTILINLGATAGEQGNYAREDAYYQEGLVLAHQIGHREWISFFLMNLGEMTAEQGDTELAEQYFQEGLFLARQIEHRESMCVLLLNLGTMFQQQGNTPRAEAYLQEGLTLARQLGIPQITCNVLYVYGNLYLNDQQPQAAETAFQEMLTLVPEGGQDLLALARYGLAQTSAAQGDIQRARTLGETSLEILHTIGHRKGSEVEAWLSAL